MRALILLPALLFAPAAHAAEYVLVATPYASLVNFIGPCAPAEPCANFPPGAVPTGSFVTAAPLPPNLNDANVLPLVSSFTFFDGITVYASNDPSVRVQTFEVTTDANGTIVDSGLRFQRWLTGSSPHAPGDRLAAMSVGTGGVAGAFRNVGCVTVATTSAGVGDACVLIDPGPTSSVASDAVVGPWLVVVPAKPVPGLAHAALALLALMLAAVGVRAARARSHRG